jgi:hypothetical protein
MAARMRVTGHQTWMKDQTEREQTQSDRKNKLIGTDDPIALGDLPSFLFLKDSGPGFIFL